MKYINFMFMLLITTELCLILCTLQDIRVALVVNKHNLAYSSPMIHKPLLDTVIYDGTKACSTYSALTSYIDTNCIFHDSPWNQNKAYTYREDYNQIHPKNMSEYNELLFKQKEAEILKEQELDNIVADTKRKK